MKNQRLLRRIIVFVLIMGGFSYFSYGQNWTKNLPKNKVKNHSLTLKDYQKAFYRSFKEAKAGKVEASKENEAEDEMLEKFKRWEWYWETRVNPGTGAFPKTSAFKVYQRYLETHPKANNQNTEPWISRGPVHSQGGYAGLGRINCVAFSPADTNVLYVGSASGGIWKTTNGGSNWTPLGDFNNALGVSDMVVINENGKDIIYLATGDRDAWDTRSVGILKSVDGGQTWDTTGLTWEQWQGGMVYRLLKAPSDNNILYAATNDGLYQTTDAGEHWFTINSLHFRDLEFQPGSNSRMYGATTSGSIYYSEDAGKAWVKAIDNPDNNRTELAVSPDSANVVYAVMASSNNSLYGIYRSRDAGKTYTMVFNTLNLLGWSTDGSDSGGQGWYDLSIAVDPHNAQKVFVGGVNTWMSENGGKSWKLSNHWYNSSNGNNAVAHADKHDLVYQKQTNTLFECNDGGIYKTKNGKQWDYIGNGLVVSQIYRLGTSATVNGEVITGLQDNGTKLFSANNWNDVLGGDGMECAIDFTDANMQYGELYYGNIYRTKDHWGTLKKITSGLSGYGAWVTPYVIDPNNHKTLYVGYQDVFKSTDQGDSWTKLSSWGGNRLQSLAISPSDSNVIYTATYKNIYRTIDNGTSWTNITGTLPIKEASINYITVSMNDPNTVWVAFGAFNNYGVFQSQDGGKTWSNISDGLPAIPINCVTQNNLFDTTELFAGTDVGVFVKRNNNNWQPYNNQLPNVVVDELEIHYDSLSGPTLYAATFGRGLWSVDISNEVSLTSAFKADTLKGTPPFTVHFTDQSKGKPTSWHWDFGNGKTSTQQNPTTTFDSVGNYTVTLTVINNKDTVSETKTNYIRVKNLVSRFTLDTTSGYLPFTVHFTDQSAGHPTSWKWSFGDGFFDTVQNPIHTYRTAGTFSVVEIIRNNSGSDTIQQSDIITTEFKPNPLKDSIKHYYKFDGDFVDVVGGVNGRYSHEVTFTKGIINQAVPFGGSANDYVTTDNYSAFNYCHDGSDFTISVWEKHNSADRSSKYILGNDIGADMPGIFFKVDSTDVQFTVGRNYPYPAFAHTWDSVLAPDTTQWNHLVITYNHSLSSNQYTLYVNGKNVGSASQLEPCEKGNSFNPMRFGINKTTGTIQPFKGDLDELGFWDRTLTADEVSELYNYGAGLSYPFNSPLRAEFSSDTLKGTPPFTVHFTDQSKGKAASWLWNFGNGKTSTDQNPTTTYDSLGYYTVTLTVANDKDTVTEVKTNYIKVKNLVCRFSADTTSGAAPLTVHFTDQSVGSPTAWFWDFNNDNIPDSTSQNPSWKYTEPGLYSVTLYVANGGNIDTLTRKHFIQVNLNIPDTNFRKVINERLGYTYPETVTHNPTKEEMASISDLDASNRGITDISGAQYLVNCLKLSFDNNNIFSDNTTVKNKEPGQRSFTGEQPALQKRDSLKQPIKFSKILPQSRNENRANKINDYSPLAGLVKLQQLSLRNTGCIDISFVKNLTNLTKLVLWENKVSDISPLANLTNLAYLDLDDNKVKDINALAHLINLQILYLDNNRSSDINPLSNLTNLWLAGIGGDSISDISALSNLTNLNYLWAYGNNISDLNPIQNLTNLYGLDVSSDSISDISVLSNLTNLQYLWINSNIISDLNPVQNLSSLLLLDAETNKISKAGILAGLTSLQYLYIGYNPISDFSFLKNMTNLRRLGLDRLHLDNLKPIENLTNLTELYIYQDNLTSLRGIGNLLNLSYLDASYNPLYDIRDIDALPLNRVYLDGCKTSDFTPLVESAKNRGRLRYAYLQKNPASKEVLENQIPALTTTSYIRQPQEDSLAACYPVPVNRAVSVPDTVTLSWQANFDNKSGVTYDIYLGNGLYNQPLVAQGLTSTSYKPALQKGKNYWWRVESILNGDTVRSGVWYFNTNTSAQLVATDPVIPYDNKAVAITFNAAKGNAGLKGFTGAVYAHTGVITDKSTSPTDWRYVKAAWDKNIPSCRLSRIDTNLYLLNISPSIRAYYGVPPGEHILKLAFVFRSADGSQTGRDTDGGDIFYAVSHDSTIIFQKVSLEKGWNMASFFLKPDSMDLLNILHPFTSKNELVKVMDEQGRFIQNVPGTGWINTIGDMANTEGYYIKLTAGDQFTETGKAVSLPFDIPLQSGWNIMGYPLQKGQNARTAINTLIDSSCFVKVIDQYGGFIQNVSGLGWINTLGNFSPGQGYYIKVTRNTLLTLDKPTKAAPVSGIPFTGPPVLTTKYFNKAFKANPYFPMDIVVTHIHFNGHKVQPGDEIAVFDKGVCVGTGVVPEDTSRPVLIVASQDDPSTAETDGYRVGDPITFRYMSAGLVSPVEADPKVISGKLSFSPLATTVCGITASPEGLNPRAQNGGYQFHIFPNPATTSATFVISNPETAKMQITLMDLTGKVVRVLQDKDLPKGEGRFRYDLSSLPSGIYNVRVLRKTEKQTTLNNYKLVITR